MTELTRQTVDLSEYPDLVIIRAGMRAESVKGFWKLMKYGYQIIDSVGGVKDADELTPEGLLHNEEVIFHCFRRILLSINIGKILIRLKSGRKPALIVNCGMNWLRVRKERRFGMNSTHATASRQSTMEWTIVR